MLKKLKELLNSDEATTIPVEVDDMAPEAAVTLEIA